MTPMMTNIPTNENREREGEREMFYLTTHSTHFIYGYMASDIWLRTILIVRKETRCRHIGYSYRLAARALLYAPSQRQDNTYHGLCYTSRNACCFCCCCCCLLNVRPLYRTTKCCFTCTIIIYISSTIQQVIHDWCNKCGILSVGWCI